MRVDAARHGPARLVSFGASRASAAVQRDRRAVIDYRALNRVTVRKTFLIPNSDELKGTAAGSEDLTVGDLKEGFNHCDNEEETAKKIAVMAPTGQYLPRVSFASYRPSTPIFRDHSFILGGGGG